MRKLKVLGRVSNCPRLKEPLGLCWFNHTVIGSDSNEADTVVGFELDIRHRGLVFTVGEGCPEFPEGTQTAS